MGGDQANARLYNATIKVLARISPKMAREVVDRLQALQETLPLSA
jgi:hypothetical protein